ncbi:MAG: hypothetical protein P4L84_34120 [Isosphaeraceae bacterium]|nr:hypothetical protein [Isosphaeraceae bacterium]
MNRKRAKWSIALLVTLLSGCATGPNQRQVTQAGTPARSGGVASLFRSRDPMQARAVPARVQPTSGSAAPDERLSRFFPGMGPRGEAPVASRPAGRGTPAPPPSGPSVPPSLESAGRPAPESPEEPLTTLPVAVTVGFQEPLRMPPMPSANVAATASEPSRVEDVPAFVRGGTDPGVIPASAEVTDAAGKAPALLPGDLSFSKPDDLSELDPKVPAPSRVLPAPTADAPASAKPAPPPSEAPAPAQAPTSATAPVPADSPVYVEPMMVVSDPPRTSDALQQPIAAPLAASESPASDVVPAPPPAPALPAPGAEPTLEPSAPARVLKPASAPVPAPAVSTKPSSAPEPSSSVKSETPPMIAVADAPRTAPLPDPSLPASADAAAAPSVATPASAPVVPTVATVVSSSQVHPVAQSIPPLPSKQMPRLSPQTLCAKANPAPRPRLLASSFWPTWLRSDVAPSPSPAPRPFLASFSPTGLRPTATATATPTPSPAPRPFLASLWPTWLRSDSAAAPPQPTLASLSPSRPATPATGAKPVQTASVKPQVVHAHGCPHHACQEGEAAPWFGVNRTLETAGMFPPTYYETAIMRGGAKPYAAPPAPTMVAGRNPVPATPPLPAAAPPATAPVPTPAVAVAAAPRVAPQPKPKRVWLITRLWNRIHGESDTTQPTASASNASAPPAPTNVAVAPPPTPSPVPPSGNAVPGNLPQRGESVERVSAERVNEAAQR